MLFIYLYEESECSFVIMNFSDQTGFDFGVISKACCNNSKLDTSNDNYFIKNVKPYHVPRTPVTWFGAN